MIDDREDRTAAGMRSAPTVDDGFVLAAVGDCMSTRAIGALLERDHALRAAVDVIRGSHVGFGNLETGILDLASFGGWLTQMQDWAMVGPPEVASDLRALGFSLMSRANNHAVDWSVQGVRETGRRLDDVGIVHGGVGETLADATAARYLETPSGRVGLVSFHTTTRSDGGLAMDQFGRVPPRPGFSGLRLRLEVRLPQTAFEAVRRLERALDPAGMNAISRPGSEGLTLFDVRFEPGDDVEVRHRPVEDDLERLERAVRQAREFSDLLVVSAHVHEEGPDAGTQPAFLTEVVHRLLDAGGDVFVGHGVHRLWPVEMHGAKPVLYGLGNFICIDITEPMPPTMYDEARHLLDVATATDADVIRVLNRESFDDDRYFRSVIARLEWRDQRWTTTLHPVDLGFGEPFTRSGIPRLARDERAREILRPLLDHASSSGTPLELDGDVAVLRASGARVDV